MVRGSEKRKREVMEVNTSRNRRGRAESAELNVNKWNYLPSGPLGQIFANLNPVDMLLVVPLVSKNWGRILLEILFCKENNNFLDFRPLEKEPFYSIFYRLGDENSRAMKLMNLLVGVMHAFASDGQSDAEICAVGATPIIKIVFPFGLPFYDRHLVYIAERCPELKSIFTPCAKNITGKGISRAMRFWSGMEKILYGLFNEPHLPRTIEEIGINCKNLQSLFLTGFDLHWQSADIIVRNLKSLKLLCLCAVCISKYGLQILLSRSKKVEGVKLCCCFFLTNEGRDYSREIRILRIQEGRRTKWRTDKYPDRIHELHTSKELVNLLWQR